ncbi:MAG: PEP-CTERM sorting domain-containing protein, partial [Betaproteobacteria bacterium]
QTTPDDLNSPDGSFYVTNARGNTGAVNRGNTLLAGLSSSSANYTIHLLHSLSDPQHQDFVYGTFELRQEVPEPAPLTLIGAAIVALFVMRRRMVATRMG